MPQSAADTLDQVALRMLAVLQADARVSVASLAERVGISRANAHSRMAALIESGVIRRFTVDLDPAAVGLPLAAAITVTTEQRAQIEDIPRTLDRIPYIHYGAYTTGGYDVLVLARVPDVAVLRRDVLWPLQQQSFVRSTQTWVVLEDVVDRPIALAGQAAAGSARTRPVAR